MSSSATAYREIVRLIDDVLLGPDLRTEVRTDLASPTVPSGQSVSPLPEEKSPRLVTKRPVWIVAVDEPRLLPNGQVFDPLLSDSESQPRITAAVNPDLITINGEWSSPDFLHRLEICAEISNRTRRGRLFLNGRQLDI